MDRETRRLQLHRIARGKDGMLVLQRLRHVAVGLPLGSPPVVRPNDSLEQMIQQILDYESLSKT